MSFFGRAARYIDDIVFMNKIRKKHVCLGRGTRIMSDSKVEGCNKFGNNVVFMCSSIGAYSYLSHDCYFVKSTIGRFCSIGSRVRIIEGNHPTTGFVSTSPAFYDSRVFECIGLNGCSQNHFEEHKYADADGHYAAIGNDVWIGSDARILEGCRIGDGAIIGGGAYVTKDIPPYAIAVGVPAKVIKFRFTEEEMRYLSNQKWWDNTIDDIIAQRDSFRSIEAFMNRHAEKG